MSGSIIIVVAFVMHRITQGEALLRSRVELGTLVRRELHVYIHHISNYARKEHKIVGGEANADRDCIGVFKV